MTTRRGAAGRVRHTDDQQAGDNQNTGDEQPAGDDRSRRFRDVLAIAEFRALWIAHAQSRFGDQLARVAIAVLVFRQTSSASLTALTYALTFLPPLVSAPLLTGLADRHSRRTILVAVDTTRAGLVAVMAIPGMPIALMAICLVLAVSLQPLYSAARNATLPNVLAGDRYVVGLGIVNVTDSTVQVAGFALGGLIVGAIGSSPALLLNALTFLASAVLVRTGVGVQRPQHDVDSTGAPTTTTLSRRKTRLRWRDPRLLSLVALLWLYGFYIAPEGIAAPYVEQLGADAAAVGLLMAADPIGAGIGALVLSRWCGPRLRPRLIGPLAAAAGLPLIIGTAVPSVPWVVAFWALSGALSSHTVLVAAELAHIVPDDQRARAFGIASAGLQTAQGVGVLVAGSIADMLSPTLAVAMCGAAGTVCAICAGVVWRRAGDAGAREA